MVGGRDGFGVVRKCERFNLRKEVWERLPAEADFDEFGWGVKLIGLKNRWAIAVGGGGTGAQPDVQTFKRLNTSKLNKGWELLHLAG